MKKQKIPTKKDWLGASILFVPAIMMTIYAFLNVTGKINSDTSDPLNFILFGTFIFWLFAILSWTGTYYVIENGVLTARFAHVLSTKVKINDITEMSKNTYGNHNYGLSKDVLTIQYQKDKVLNISPVDRDEMIKIIRSQMKGNNYQK